MKLRIASDLHLEHTAHRFGVPRFGFDPLPDGEVDLTILAGDIAANPAEVFSTFKNWNTPVIYVAGNHEWYGGQDMAGIKKVQKKRRNPVVYLENGVFEFNGVRFLGATLWTDYLFMGDAPLAMSIADRSINDHRLIRINGRRFTPADALAAHQKSVTFLKKELATESKGPVVVITHHGPSFRSVAPRFQGDWLTSAYVSALESLVIQSDLWVHGHTHNSSDYELGVKPRGRVLCNPRGYPLSGSTEDAPLFENREFKPELIITI